MVHFLKKPFNDNGNINVASALCEEETVNDAISSKEHSNRPRESAVECKY